MAYSPVALTMPQYDENPNWWLKAYDQGTTDPLSMATDATGDTLLVKAPLDAQGFPKTSSIGARFTPFINGDYDLWLFPTDLEADSNITINAIQLADNLNTDVSGTLRADLASTASGKGAELIGYINNGTGAVAQTVDAVLQEHVSVISFGATGDGVTDDETALQDAIDYCSANLLRLFFPPGTYIATDIVVNTNSYWYGEKGTVFLKHKTGSTAPFVVGTTVNNVTLDGIGFDGNKAAIAGTYINLFFTGCYAIDVKNCVSRNSPSFGIDIREGTDVANNTWSHIKDCFVHDNTTIGISHNNQDRVRINGNTIIDNGSHGINGGGTVQDNDEDIEIEHNLIEGNGGYGINESFIGADFDIVTGRKSPMRDVSIIGNTCRNNDTGGALVQANGYIVANNKFLSNGTNIAHPGVVCNGNNGTITGNRCIGNTGIGIDVGLADIATVTGNLTTFNGATGITAEASTHINISVNTIKNNSTSGSGVFPGIKIEGGNTTFDGNTTDIVCVGNEISDTVPNQSYAILVQDNNGTGAYTCNDVIVANNYGNNAGTAISDIFVKISTCRYYNNFTNISQRTIASAATMTIYEGHDDYSIAGTTNIDTINTAGGGLFIGRKIDLQFNDVLTVNDGTGNLALQGNFTTSVNDMLLLRWDGTNWIERSRSPN